MNIRHLLSGSSRSLVCLAVLALVAGAFGAGAAAASPRLQAYPVKLVGYEGDDLRIAFELPCGSAFYGLIAAADGKGKLAIAAASLQPEILCTGLPEEQSVLVKYLATSGFETITTMATEGLLNRLAIVPVNEVLVAKTRKRGRSLRAVYETRCGEAVGALIRQASDDELEIAMVELKARPSGVASTGGQDCAATQQLKPIAAITLDEGYAVQPLDMKNVDVSRVSYLRLASIDSRHLATHKGKGPLAISYFRACNEAPVGVVVSKATIKPDAAGRKVREVKVGVLVARYLNLTCVKGERGEWRKLPVKDLALRSSDTRPLRLVAMAETEGAESLRLKAPFEIDRFAARGATRGLMIDFFKTCEETVGAVYARDRGGRLAVGILTTAADTASPCKKAATRVSSKASMMQPFLARHVRAADLFPMKLQGH